MSAVRDGSSFGIVNNATYHNNGMLHTLVRANSVTDTQALDAAANWRLREIHVGRSGTTLWSTGAYAYDSAGNIKSLGSDSYAYDRLSRLTAATVHLPPPNQSTAVPQTFSYDSYGNLTEISHNTPGGGSGPGIINLSTGNNNHLDDATYDPNGNVVSLELSPTATMSFEYDPFNRSTLMLKDSIERTFLYTAGGERLATLDLTLGDETFTPRSATNQVLRRFVQSGGSWNARQAYVYAGSQQIARLFDGSPAQHLHLDHLGSTRLVTDDSGAVVSEYKLYPYGAPLHFPSTNDEELLFTGHERDANGGLDSSDDLDDMHARYYTPWLGRFLSIDAAAASPERPGSWNLYSYASGSPLGRLDPDGNKDKKSQKNENVGR